MVPITEQIGQIVKDHFTDASKMGDVGSRVQRPVKVFSYLVCVLLNCAGKKAISQKPEKKDTTSPSETLWD